MNFKRIFVLFILPMLVIPCAISYQLGNEGEVFFLLYIFAYFCFPLVHFWAVSQYIKKSPQSLRTKTLLALLSTVLLLISIFVAARLFAFHYKSFELRIAIRLGWALCCGIVILVNTLITAYIGDKPICKAFIFAEALLILVSNAFAVRLVSLLPGYTDLTDIKQ